MTAPESFSLAEYAYTRLNPLMMSVNGFLQLQLSFGSTYPGLDVWVHAKTDSSVIGYRTALTTKEQVDQFASTLQPEPVSV